MNQILLGIVIFALIGISCQEQAQTTERRAVPVPVGSYMGIDPGTTPELLFPGFISTQFGEYNGTFNHDGTEFFYTVSIPDYDVIVHSQLQNDGTWSAPERAPFSQHHPEWDPLFAPDGKRLYYSSHRPVAEELDNQVCNIWYVDEEEGKWGEPVYVPLHGPSKGNYYSSVAENGNIYFNIWSTGDLFRAIPVDTGYVVESLGDIVNSSAGDGDPFVAPDEKYLIFRSYRDGGVGSGDFWISFNIDGEWKAPVNMGEPVNSRYNEMCPYVTTDGNLFIFSSDRFERGDYYANKPGELADVAEKWSSADNGMQNIYTMSTSVIDSLRALHFIN